MWTPNQNQKVQVGRTIFPGVQPRLEGGSGSEARVWPPCAAASSVLALCLYCSPAWGHLGDDDDDDSKRSRPWPASPLRGILPGMSSPARYSCRSPLAGAAQPRVRPACATGCARRCLAGNCAHAFSSQGSSWHLVRGSLTPFCYLKGEFLIHPVFPQVQTGSSRAPAS